MSTEETPKLNLPNESKFFQKKTGLMAFFPLLSLFVILFMKPTVFFPRKTFAAHTTLVRFFAGMNKLMTLNICRRMKWLQAVLAFKATHTLVVPLVFLMLLGMSKLFLTVLASQPP